MNAAKAFGIAFKVTGKQMTKMLNFGFDIEEASGEDHHLLPVPSVFLINTDGSINFSYVNPDYKVRLDPALLLKAIETALPE